MMGRNDQPQNPLFYAFNLDDLVPQDHLLRKIDRFLDPLVRVQDHLTRRTAQKPHRQRQHQLPAGCLGQHP